MLLGLVFCFSFSLNSSDEDVGDKDKIEYKISKEAKSGLVLNTESVKQLEKEDCSVKTTNEIFVCSGAKLILTESLIENNYKKDIFSRRFLDNDSLQIKYHQRHNVFEHNNLFALLRASPE